MSSILRVRDENGNFIPISAIQGEKGDDYVLTDADKQEIAEIVYGWLTNGDEESY